MSGTSSSRLFLMPCLQGALATVGLLCSCLRVALHRAHWEDALAGTLLGTAVALYLARIVLNGFRERFPSDVCRDAFDQALGRLEGGVGAQVPSSLFRYFRIPHVTYKQKLSRPYHHHHHGRGSKPGSLHEEFQRDLHQRIEDYVTKRPSMRETGSKF